MTMKHIPGCSCCKGKDACVKLTPFGAPWIERTDSSNRFSNWAITGANQGNTFSNAFGDGNLQVVAGLTFSIFTGYESYVRLYAGSTSSTDPVAEWVVSGVPISGPITFTELNGSGIAGTVDYDVPLSTVGTYTFTIQGTNNDCDLTVGGVMINTITWQVTAIDDPFELYNGSLGLKMTISNTSTDLIRSLPVNLAGNADKCLAEAFYSPTLPSLPIFVEYEGNSALDEYTQCAIHFNNFTGSSWGKFAIVGNFRASGGGRIVLPLIQVPGPAFDICLEIPPTVYTEPNYGSTATIRMDHS